MTPDTFLWHDYETFGADTRRDRPCQFAALRTDTELNPVGEPLMLYCKPTHDMLPAPDACLITGITPQYADAHGLPEYEFAQRIAEAMERPGTCAVGYNNFRFDDEITRFMFWRNFLDPYRREYANGNSRFDLIDVLRLTRALRPDGLTWFDREDGHPGFRLEDLAAANGLVTDDAHDAMADVRNTVELARRLRAAQPRLWDWALKLRDKATVDGLLSKREILLHVSARIPAEQHCIAPIVPLFRHPQIASQWLVWNLRVDPAPFEDLDPELLSDLHWTPAADLPEGMQRLPVKWVRTNRCPMIAPTAVLDDAAASRTGIDLEQAGAFAERLAAAESLQRNLIELMGAPRDAEAMDADVALYAGFLPRGDRGLVDRVRDLTPVQVAEWINRDPAPFSDDRLNDLLLRFAGRHAPEALDPEPASEWEHWRRRRLLDDPDLGPIQLDAYQARVETLARDYPERTELFDALRQWPIEIGFGKAR